MNFTTAEIAAGIGAFLWPLFRIAGFVGAAPVFGARSVPMRLRLGLALLLTLVIAPVVPAPAAVDPLSAPGLFTTLHQVLIGIAMGLLLRIAFAALDLAGQLISQLMGLGFASMMDPQNGVSVPVVGQLYTILTVLIFLAVNGHHVMIDMLAASFTALPIGATGLLASDYRLLAEWGGRLFAVGLVIALPATCALIVANLAFGVISRAAPQLNIFAVGFPATLLLGFFALLFSLPNLPAQLHGLFQEAFSAIRLMVHLAGPLAGNGAP